MVAIIPAPDAVPAQQLAQQLQQRGCNVTITTQPPEQARVIISLLAWQRFNDRDSATASNADNFALARTIASRFQRDGGSFVLVQDSGGRFALDGCSLPQAWAAGGSGLIKTAAHEWPHATVKVIDLAQSAEAITRLVDELCHGGPELEIGLPTDGKRITVDVYEQRDPGTPTTVITSESVLLVSGGARGVTAACLIALAQRYRCRFALLGRTALAPESPTCHTATNEAQLKAILIKQTQDSGEKPNLIHIQQQARHILATREIQTTLDALRQAGAQVSYHVCDVQDSAQLRTCIAELHQQWGPVTGIIHGAGVLADKAIADKTDAQFASVFNTKVRGLQALLDATATEPLTFIGLFSSVAGRFGNAGQCDYAMANEILNKVAQAEQQRRGATCLVKSLNWGPWAGGMVSEALSAHFQRRGIALLPVDTGAALFVQEASHQAPNTTEVVLGSKLPAPRNPQAEGELGKKSVSQASHAFLTDHSIKGAPVIPICMAIDWLLRGARARYPQRHIDCVIDIKVLKAARLDAFATGQEFQFDSEESEDGGLRLYLRAASGVTYYSATIPPPAPLTLRPPLTVPPGAAWPWTPQQAYQQQRIFHGPAFHVLHSLEDYSINGGKATLGGIADVSATHPSWRNEQWLVDVAGLDGGLQACWLWSAASGKPVLPMAIARFSLFQAGLFTAPVTALIRVPTQDAFRCVFDIDYCDADGRLLAAIEGLVGIRLLE